MADDLIFEIHCVTPFGREAYRGNGAVVDVTRDVKRVTRCDCQATEAFCEEMDLLQFVSAMRKRDGVLVDGVTANWC